MEAVLPRPIRLLRNRSALDWAYAVALVAGALFALSRYGAHMDVYEKAILVLAAPVFIALGWADSRRRRPEPLSRRDLGLLFGLSIYSQLKNAPVHSSMLEISELIYETCKTYLTTQGKFILVLWVFIAVIIGAYYGWLSPLPGKPILLTLAIILIFSLIGIGGSYGVAWFGIRVNTFANSRTAFAGLGGRAYPIFAIPLEAGMSIGMLLISVELLLMLCIRLGRTAGCRALAAARPR